MSPTAHHHGPAEGETVDPAEIARFDALAERWWDDTGPMRPLHAIGPARLAYIREQVGRHYRLKAHDPKPYAGLAMLDVGCAGGLVSEPLARLGAEVTGIDAAPNNIGAAKVHAAEMGLEIDYRHVTAERLVAEGRHYDVVVALEIVEHVADVPAFIAALVALLKPGGLLIMSTINRTAKSYALAIVGAEYVLRWLPRGTHDWKKFITPDELRGHMEAAGLRFVNERGMRLDLLSGRWVLAPDMAVNYLMTAARD